MSGKPWPGGADRIVEILERISEISPRATELKAQVDRAQSEYDALNDEYRTLQGEMSDLMRKMDLESVGNFGWQGRLCWLVAAVVDRVKTREQGNRERDSERE